MSKPIVAIVGRPNVGKSTLFNALSGTRLSIVQDTPGVTRDRIYADCEWQNKVFTLIDTGGIEPQSEDVILKQMREQAQIAMETADVIVFMVDVREGLMDADHSVADLLRKTGKPVLLCVNKVDHFLKQQNDVYEFYALGLGDPYPVSAQGKQGLGELLDAIVEHFPDIPEAEEDERIRVAIVGRPNVGKSSIINKLLGENRLIVSDVAGTTRDAVDTVAKYHGEEYVFIDTAGLRRKSKIKEDIERYSIIRTLSAIDRADIAVIVLDATTGITEQDTKVAGMAHEKGKGAIFVVNKWDAYEDKTERSVKEFTEQIRNKFSFMSYADVLFVSALTGQRLIKLYDEIEKVSQNQNLRVPTGVLNEILTEAKAMQQPPSDKGKRLKLYYMTQTAVKPPAFVIFVNEKELFHFSYQRYLENKLRDAFGFAGTPIHFITRERKEKDD